jgi:signal transduction histidine kinase
MSMETKTKQISTKHSWLRYGLAGVIFCIGIVLTISAFKIIHTFEERRIESEMEHFIANEMASLQRSFEFTLQSIQSMSAYVGATANIRQNGFQEQAEDLRQNRHGIATVAWVPQVLSVEQRMFMMNLHKQQGFADFSLRELSSSGETVSAAQRERYFPLTYGDPFEDIAPMTGLDMGSDPDWLKTMEQGRDKGLPIATKAFPHETEKHFQIGVFQSVFNEGLPNKLAERRANLRGFVFVTLDLDHIINQALEGLRIKYFTLHISDTQTGIKSLIVDKLSDHKTFAELNLPQNIQSGLSLPPRAFQHYLTIAGRTWSVVLTPNPTLTIAQSAWWVLGGGSMLTLLIVAYLLMLMGRTARIERLVAERTQELKESEAHLIQSEKMATIGQMMAGIVHEINTPLGYVRSSVELTGSYFSDIAETLEACEKLGKQFQSEEESDEEQLATALKTAMELLDSLNDDETLEEAQVLLENALSGLDKISSLVKNLKNFSRLDRAKTAELDVNQGLDDALAMVNHKLSDKIQIIKHYGDVPHIICSPAQVNQVFLNLLVNAIQAIPKDTGVIDLKTQVIDQYVDISIKDNGDGISKENLARIFEPFFTTKTSGKGTGLGLAIVHKIIKEHQGELNVESQIGRGTQFIISLPFKQ